MQTAAKRRGRASAAKSSKKETSHAGRQPMSKSDLIRSLHERGKETGEIREALEKRGMNVHYSEIYGAIERVKG